MEMLKPVVVITSADIRLAERYLRRQLTSPCGSLSTNVSKDVLEEGSASVPLSTIHLRTLQSKAVHRHPVKALREKPLVLISATDVSTTKRILPRRKRSERNDSSSVRRRRQLLRKALPTPSPNVLKAPSIVIDISQPASIIAGRCCDQVSTFANNVKVPQGEQQLEETASAAIDTACQQDAVSDKLPDPLESRDMCAGKRVCVTSLKHHSKPEENVSPEMDEGRVVSTVNNICSSGFELRLKALTDDINLLERYHLTEPERDLTHLKKSIANTLSDVAGLFKNHPSLVRDCHAMAYAVSPCKERLTRIEWYAKNEDPLRLPVESISQADSCVTRIKEKALSEAQQKLTCKDGHVDAATKASLVQGDTVKVLLHNKSASFVANKIKVGITCLPGLCDKAVNRDAMIDGSSGVVSTVPKIGVPNSSVDALISVLNHLHRKILAWDSSMCEFSCNRACGLTVNSSVPSYDCVEDVQDNGKSQSLLDMFSLNQVPNVKVDKTTDKKLKSEPISVKKATVQIPSTDFDCAASTHDAHSTMTLNPSLRLPYNSSSSRTDLVDNLSQHSLVSEEHFSQPEDEQMLVNKITQDVVARSDTDIKSQPVNHSPNNNIQNKVGKNVKCCRPTSVENEPIKVNSRKLVAIHKDSQCYCVSQSSKSKNVTENSTDDSLKVKEASLEDSVSCIVCEQVFHEVQQSQSFSTRDSNAKNSNRQGSVTKEDNSQNEAKQTSPYNSKNKSFERVQSELTVEQTDPDTLVAKRVLNPVLNESLNGPTDSNMHLKTDLSKNSKNESRETNQSRQIRPLSTNYGLQLKTKCADDKKGCLKNDQNRLSPFDTNTNSNIHVINPTIDESSNQFTAMPRISLRQNAKRDLPSNSKKESGESGQYQVTVSPLQDDISSPVVSCIATKKLPKRSIELRPLLKNSNLKLNSRQASSSNAKKTSKNQHRQSSPIVAETATNKPVTNRVLNNALDKSCNQHKTVTVVTDVLVNDEHSPSTGTKTQSSENEQIHSVVLATVGEASESIDSCIAGTDKNMSKNLNLHKRFLCEKNLSLTHDAKEMPFFSSEKGASQEKTTITQPNACYAKSGVDPTSSNLSLLRQEIEEAEMPHDAKQVTSSFKVGCSENKQTQLSIDQAHIISATSDGESYSIVDEKLEPNKSLCVDCDLQLSPKVTYYEKKTDESNKNHVTIPQTDTIGDHGSNNSFSENLTQPIHNKPVYRKSNLHSKAEQSFSSSSKKGLSENVVQNDVNTSVSFVRHVISINSDASVAMEQKLHVKEVKTVQEKNDSNANEDCHSTRVMTSRIRRKKNFDATPKIKQTPVTHSETDSLKHLEKRSTPVQTNTESTKAVNSVILNVNQSEPEPVVSTLQVGVKLTSSTSSEMGSVEQECTLIEADNDISTSIVNPISKNNLSKHLLSEMNSGSKANGKLGPLKNCEKAFQKCLQSPIKLSKSYTGMDSCLMRHSQPDISSTPSGVDPMLEKQGNDDLNFFKPKIAETDNGILTLDAQQLACNICTSSYASETNELELVGTDISSRNSKVSYQYQKKLDDGLNKFKSVSIDNSNLKLGASCTATKHRKAETCRGVIAPVVTLDSSISLDNNSNLSQLPVDNNSKSKPDNQVVSTDLNPHHSSIDNQPASAQSCDGSIKYAVSSVCLNNEEKQQCRHVVRKVSNMKRTKKRLTSTSCTKDCGLKTATQLTAPNKASEPSAHVVCPNVVSGVYSSKFERITPPVSECRKPHFRHKNHSSKASDSGTNVIPKLDTDLKTVMSVPVNTASLIGDVKSRTPVVILSRLSIVDINKMCTSNQEKDMPNVPNATAAQCVKPLRIDEEQSVTSTAQLCEGVTTAVCVKTLRVKKKVISLCTSNKPSHVVGHELHNVKNKVNKKHLEKDQRTAHWKRRLRDRRSGGNRKCKPLNVNTMVIQNRIVKTADAKRHLPRDLRGKRILSSSPKAHGHSELDDPAQFTNISKSKPIQVTKMCEQKTVGTMCDFNTSSDFVKVDNFADSVCDGNETQNTGNTTFYKSEATLQQCKLEAELITRADVNSIIAKPALRKRKVEQKCASVNLQNKKRKYLKTTLDTCKTCPAVSDLPPQQQKHIVGNSLNTANGSVLNKIIHEEETKVDETVVMQKVIFTDPTKSKRKLMQHNPNKCVKLGHKKYTNSLPSNVASHKLSLKTDTPQKVWDTSKTFDATAGIPMVQETEVLPTSTQKAMVGNVQNVLCPNRHKRRSVDETLISELSRVDNDCKVRLRERKRLPTNQIQQPKKTRKLGSLEVPTCDISAGQLSFKLDDVFKTYYGNQNWNPIVVIPHAEIFLAEKHQSLMKYNEQIYSTTGARRQFKAPSQPVSNDVTSLINCNPFATVAPALPETRHLQSVSTIMGAPVIEKLLSGLRSFALPNCKNMPTNTAEDSSCEKTLGVFKGKDLAVNSVSDVENYHANTQPFSPSNENISSSQVKQLTDCHNITNSLDIEHNKVCNNEDKDNATMLKAISDVCQTKTTETTGSIDNIMPELSVSTSLASDGIASHCFPTSDSVMPSLYSMINDASDTQELLGQCIVPANSTCIVPINVSPDEGSSNKMQAFKVSLSESPEVAEKNLSCSDSEHSVSEGSIPLDLSSVGDHSTLKELPSTELPSSVQSGYVEKPKHGLIEHLPFEDCEVNQPHEPSADHKQFSCEEITNVSNSENKKNCLVSETCEEQQATTQAARLFDEMSDSLPSLSGGLVNASSKTATNMLPPMSSTTPETSNPLVSDDSVEKTIEDIAVDTLRAAALSVQDSLRSQANMLIDDRADSSSPTVDVNDVAIKKCGSTEDGIKFLDTNLHENESLVHDHHKEQDAEHTNVSVNCSSPATEDSTELQSTNCGIAVDKLIAATLQIDDVPIRDHFVVSEPKLENSESSLEKNISSSEEVLSEDLVSRDLLSSVPKDSISTHDHSSPPEINEAELSMNSNSAGSRINSTAIATDVDDIDVAKLLATTLTENESAENNLPGVPEASTSPFPVNSRLPFVDTTSPYVDTTLISRNETGDDIDVDKLLATSPESDISAHQSASSYLNTGSPYANSGSPYVNSGSPYVSTGSPYVSTGSPYVSTGSPYVSTGSPYVNSGSPYVNNGSPYISNASPYVNNNSPYVSNASPYVSSQMSANEHTNDDIDVDKLLAVSLPSDDTSVGSHSVTPGVALTNFSLNSAGPSCVDSSVMTNEETNDDVDTDNLLATTSPFNDPPLYRPAGSPETGLSDLPDESFVDGSMMADDESSDYNGAQMLSDSPSIDASDMTVIPSNLDSFDPVHTSTGSQTTNVLQLENGDVVFVMDSANYTDSPMYMSADNADNSPCIPTSTLSSVHTSGSVNISTGSSHTVPSFVQSRPTAIVDPMPQNQSSAYMSSPTTTQNVSHAQYNVSGAAPISVHDTNQRLFSTPAYNSCTTSNTAPTNSFMPLASNYVVPVYTPNATVPVNIPIQAWSSCMPNLTSNVVPSVLPNQGSVQFQNVMTTSTLACETQWNVANGNQATISMPTSSGPVPYVAQNASHPMLIGVPFSNDPQQFHVFAAQPQLNSVVASPQNTTSGAPITTPEPAHTPSFPQVPSLLSTNTVVCESQNSNSMNTGYADVSRSAPYMIPHMSESSVHQPTVFGMPFGNEPHQVHIFSTQPQMQNLVNSHNGGGIACNMMLASSSCGLPQVPQTVISTTACGITSSALQNTSVNFPLTLPTAEVAAMLNHESNSLFYQNGILFPDDIPQHEITISDGSEQNSSSMCTSADQTYLGRPYAIQCQPHKYDFPDEPDSAVHLVPRNVGSLLPKSHREEKKLLAPRPACPICGKVYSYPANVQRHMNVVHKQYEARRSTRAKRT